MNAPRWSEAVLRWLLPDRDRGPISGDLLEEYREAVVPTLGERRARWWYRRQVAGFVWRAVRLPLLVGLALGAALGATMLIDTARQPLAEDDGQTMIVAAGMVLLLWSAAALAATWRTRRMSDAVKAGVILGVVTLLVFQLAAIVRINVFLDAIQYRDDWHNLLLRYSQSGFHSLRAYANYEYVVTVTPLLIGAIGGSISGTLGGLVHIFREG
jgi:hypothetical protein